MDMVSPIEWGARVNYDAWAGGWKPTDSLALHHGGSGNYPAHNAPYMEGKEIAQLRAWEAYHIDGQGWRGIAYNWAIGQTGTVYRLRGWNRPGAHTGDHDDDGIPNNDEIGAILFIGSGSQVSLSNAAQAAVAELRAYIEDEVGKALKLYGHQEVSGNTSCPGQYGMEYVVNHRDLEEDMPTAAEVAQAVWAFPSLTTQGGVPISALKQLKWIYDTTAALYVAHLSGTLGADIQLGPEDIEAIVDAIEDAGIADAVADELAARLAS